MFEISDVAITTINKPSYLEPHFTRRRTSDKSAALSGSFRAFRVGVHLEQDFEIGDVAAVGRLSLGYEQVFGDRSATGISDVGVGGALIVETAGLDATRLLLGAGMTFGRGPVQGYARYDGAFGHDSDKHSGTVGVSYQF